MDAVICRRRAGSNCGRSGKTRMKIKVVGAAGGKVIGCAYFARTDRGDVVVKPGMFPPPL